MKHFFSAPRLFGLLMAVLLILPFHGHTQIPERPSPPRLVNDMAGILSAQEKNYLERKLVNFNDTTSNQITIVIVPDFNGYDKADFAYRIGEKWKVGQKKFDNGVVIAIRPKTNRNRGEAFIAVGYGLEPVIPDAIANRIVDNEMIPYFEKKAYFKGLDEGTNTLMGLAAGEFTSDQYRKKTSGGGAGFLVPIIVMIIVIVMIKRGNSSHRNINGRGGSSGLLGMLLLMSMGNRHSGNWNDFSSGSGSFGGGGGFGGFGGGSFGGGGAGGSW